MILDYMSYNYVGIILSTVLVNIYILDNKRLYIILILDIIFNKIPYVTFILVLMYYLKEFIFKYINYNFRNKYIVLVIIYVIFNIILYSIFNKFSMNIIYIIKDNIGYNLIYYYVSLKGIEYE